MRSSQFLVIIIKNVEIVTQGPDTNTAHIDRYPNQNCPCPSPHRYFARDGHAESTQTKGEVTQQNVVCFVMTEEEF